MLELPYSINLSLNLHVTRFKLMLKECPYSPIIRLKEINGHIR